MELAGRAALITGCAGGLGRATVRFKPHLNGENIRLPGALRFSPK
jgi:hypothetical protein